MSTNTNTLFTSNFLSPTRFIIVIDTPEFESVSYHCQKVNLPNISAPAVQMAYRQYLPSVTGSIIKFEPLTARFIIDEDMENWNRIYNWMFSTVHEDSQSEMKKDLSLLIYNNNNLHHKKFQFVGCFPTDLSPVEFDTTVTDKQYLFSDVTFSIDYYVPSNRLI